MKLYQFYLGIQMPHANLEMHDVQFAVVPTAEAAFPDLKRIWAHTDARLHVDGWREINWAAGYDIVLQNQANELPEKLFFVNVGAYADGQLAELHDFDLFVAHDEKMAKEQALATLLPHANQQHKDNLKDVDNILQLNQFHGWFVHLRANPNGQAKAIEFQGYLPI
ncbi:DUF1543 domain-containing protein [Wielerella bovis]|uniref:DUF1543 domain-containing protein n=1 Tax=Wielerella bovis TaxID=2917790 RepID=UPI002019C3A1|nr:DUF1543 domain-containing protein [Wielerella bovis]MCG7656383.1 DUF1543 domain-containing protein [Wielerella bovis]MCG7658608.1 DUF1543 domain-containing protein [Wielerella bovis]